mgnify:CR=1 FL=1
MQKQPHQSERAITGFFDHIDNLIEREMILQWKYFQKVRLSSLRSADITSQKIMGEFSQAGSGESISGIGHFLQKQNTTDQI